MRRPPTVRGDPHRIDPLDPTGPRQSGPDCADASPSEIPGHATNEIMVDSIKRWVARGNAPSVLIIQAGPTVPGAHRTDPSPPGLKIRTPHTRLIADGLGCRWPICAARFSVPRRRGLSGSGSGRSRPRAESLPFESQRQGFGTRRHFATGPPMVRRMRMDWTLAKMIRPIREV